MDPIETRGEPLIITVTVAPSWIHPDANNAPRTAKEVIAMVVKCYEAGASIAHIHGATAWPMEVWREVIKGIREKCDIAIQLGLSAQTLEERLPLFDLKVEMISIILNHHDERFTRTKIQVLHPLEEIEAYAKLCLEKKMKPEFEVWHTGSIWNLNQLIGKSLVEKPYLLTLFFAWPGGIWSPPTADELLHRVKSLPPHSVFSVSVMDHAQTRLEAMSIALGGHVRVGTEDNPYYEEGVLAKDNAQLVARMARISKELGRPVADFSQTKEILRLRK